MGWGYVHYQVIKVFNNNVVLAKQNRQEMILVSKGIGFGKKPGESLIVDTKSIEKVFHQLNANDSIGYLDRIVKYDKEIIGVSEEIIAKAEIALGPLSPNIHTALVDHITFALDRIYMDLPIENPFIEEIILLYQEEYDLAEVAASLIKERLGIHIGEDEKGFIALHLHSARNNKTIRETMKDTRLFKTCIDIIIQETGTPLMNENYSLYQSCILNLKTLLYHCKKEKIMNNPLKKEIKNKIVESYKVAKQIGMSIKKETNIILSDEMIAYIAIEIEKIRQF